MTRVALILVVACSVAASTAQQQQKASATISVADAKGLGIRWAKIPAGTFQMGCVPGDKECDVDEKPRHSVTLTKDYWLMTTEVTIEMFRTYASDGHAMPLQPDWNANPRQPVVNMPWDGASGFCGWLAARLPTEAEFDRAARANVDGALYAWGNQPLPLPNGLRPANVADDSAKRKNPKMTVFTGYDDAFAATAPVGSFAANVFGVHDLAGNVFEWVSDYYSSPYPDGPVVDPRVTAVALGLLRGGSWIQSPRYQRLSMRMGYPRDARFPDFGFRCAKDVAK